MEHIIATAKLAKTASSKLALLSSAQKNAMLLSMAERLNSNSQAILAANALDIEAARKAGRPEAMIDRLALSQKRISDMADAICSVAALPDPVGEIIGGGIRPNGLEIIKKRVPLGVVGIIYEARPNVTADAAALCLKTGNAVILRGGSEAINSNKAIVAALCTADGLVPGAVGLITDTTREAAAFLMGLTDYLDVLIPRGGAGLIRSVVQNAKVPCIQTGTGNCHIFVDSSADIPMALDIIHNSKTSRPSVCNAAETVLLHSDIAADFLPKMRDRLSGVELRGCERCCASTGYSPATDEDYATEFLDYILAVRVVSGLDEAIEHINKYGTKHSECIVTRDLENARRFQAEIDAAVVYVNASTRFTDGGEFGFGAEIGISTQKLHARGPMGLTELTTIKYLVNGNGQIR